ncbi:hypothetical protein PQR11_17825 [Paraburkholderia strydomiana]|uniref:hypothetical protein n=1 Tax=Paraburkholderia strydomiana TaxID=1245417 RepID=UPI0038BB2481
MSSKSRVRKHNSPAMSPLLRALTQSRSTHEPVTAAMLLQCYAALDAFEHGHGSRDLHMSLSRHLLVSQELARLGLGEDLIDDIESGHAAMVQLDSREQITGKWTLSDDEHARLCTSLAILNEQLSVASLSEIASAQARMIEGLMRSARTRAIAEAVL